MNKDFNKHVKKINLGENLEKGQFSVISWDRYAYGRKILDYDKKLFIYYEKLDENFYGFEKHILSIIEDFISTYDDIEVDDDGKTIELYMGEKLIIINKDSVEYEVSNGGGEIVMTKRINKKIKELMVFINSKKFGL